MKLFNESENKYYELLTYLINGKESYTNAEIVKVLNERLEGSHDLDIEDVLFNHNPDKATVFTYADGKYIPVFADPLPIRCNRMDLQATQSLMKTPFVDLFLLETTKEKIMKISNNIEMEWSIRDIKVKNQFQRDAQVDSAHYASILKLIFQAIQNHCSIKYDNIVKGKYEFKDEIIFPVKVEYSFINDVFRICAYSEKEDRFIKMNLATLSNVRISTEKKENLDVEYKEYIELNTKKVVLDVEPIDHVIERCFRIFSYHDRLAKYDKENNKYTLEINYLKADESEIIRDILSLGGYVVVTEPRRIQKEVYKRIVLAKMRYEE